jgi:hypothetical protein
MDVFCRLRTFCRLVANTAEVGGADDQSSCSVRRQLAGTSPAEAEDVADDRDLVVADDVVNHAMCAQPLGSQAPVVTETPARTWKSSRTLTSLRSCRDSSSFHPSSKWRRCSCR